MKFLSSALLALVFVPVESALESGGCILGANGNPRTKSDSETTKLFGICDQRRVTSPTR